jgi:PST family polysaccharide transporter
VWAFLSTASGKVITLVGLMLLARILAPHEFGLLAFALVFMTYADTIGDLGSGMALVYWPDRRDDAAQVTFLVNVAAGLFWCLLTFFLAPHVADFFNSPQGTPLIRTLAFGFIIKYLGNTHDALAQKDLRFRARAIPEVGFAGLKAIVAIALAWYGLGAWSLVWGHLAGLTASTVLHWVIVPWRPSFRIPRDLFRPMLTYGRGIIAVNTVGAMMYQIDLAVVGRVLGTTVLGLYQMASKIPETTVVVLLWVVSRVLFPAFSRLNAAGEDLREPYLIATRYVAAMTVPASLGLYFLAGPLMVVFFGREWAPAAPILSAFAIYGGVRSLDHHSGDVLKAIGRAQLLAALAVVKAVLIVTAVLIGARISGAAVAWSLAIAYGVGTVVTLMTVVRTVRVPFGSILKAFAPSAQAGLVMSIALFFWMRFSGGLVPVGVMAIGVLIGAGVYLGTLRLIDREIFQWAKESLFTRGTAATPDALLRAAR